MICHSCGGVIGRDCFNPEECAQIGAQQQEEAWRNSQEAQQSSIDPYAQLAALEERVRKLEQRIAQE